MGKVPFYIFFLTKLVLQISAAGVPIQVTDCDIIPLVMYICEGSENEYEMETDLRTKDDTGGKILDATADLFDEVNNSYTVVNRISKFENGEWISLTAITGFICDLLEEYASKCWTKVKQQINPPLEAPCTIPPNHYELHYFEIYEKEISLPAYMEGRIKSEMTFIKPDGEEFGCHAVEVEVNCS